MLCVNLAVDECSISTCTIHLSAFVPSGHEYFETSEPKNEKNEAENWPERAGERHKINRNVKRMYERPRDTKRHVKSGYTNGTNGHSMIMQPTNETDGGRWNEGNLPFHGIFFSTRAASPSSSLYSSNGYSIAIRIKVEWKCQV